VYLQRHGVLLRRLRQHAHPLGIYAQVVLHAEVGGMSLRKSIKREINKPAAGAIFFDLSFLYDFSMYFLSTTAKHFGV